MMNRIFLYSSLLFSFVPALLRGQDVEYFEGQRLAETEFKNENYATVIAICNDNKRNYPAKNTIRENLFFVAEQCKKLLNKDCDTIALNEIKEIRAKSGYHLTIHPKTDKKIENCRNNINESNDANGLSKGSFNPNEVISKNSYPLDDSIQLEIIRDFLDNFAKAFKNKDSTYIEMVFSDYALIIHEKRVEYLMDKEGNKVSSSFIQRTEKNKVRYIEELKDAFRKNDFIEVYFHNIKILRSKKDTNVYGVNLLQVWNSSFNYHESGCGWVYFEIDFNELNEPLIWVKTWQPFDTPSYARYWLGSFIGIKLRK